MRKSLKYRVKVLCLGAFYGFVSLCSFTFHSKLWNTSEILWDLFNTSTEERALWGWSLSGRQLRLNL